MRRAGLYSIITLLALLLSNNGELHSYIALLMLGTVFLFEFALHKWRERYTNPLVVSSSSGADLDESLRHFYEHSSEIQLLVSAKALKILECNLSAPEQLGYDTKYQILGLTLFELCDSRSHDKLKVIHSSLQHKGKINQWMIMLLTKKQQLVYTSMNATLIPNNGKDSIQLSFSNVSNFEKLKNELNERKQFLRSILNNSGDGIIITDQFYNIVEWNRRSEMLFGLVGADAKNSKLSALFDPMQFKTINKTVNSMQQESRTITVYGMSKQKKKIPLDLKVSRFVRENKTYYCFMLFDISTELNSRMRKQRLVRLVSQSNDAIIVLDNNLSVIEWNPGASHIFNRTANQVLGKSFEDNLTNEQGSLLADLKKLMTREIELLESEYTMKVNEHEKHLAVSATILTHRDKLLGVSLIARDVTQQYYDRQQLQKLSKELQHSNDELESFAYIASHDLKEPLRSIRNYAEILIDDYADKLDEDGLNMINVMMQQTTRITSMIESLLNYSRVGMLELELKPVDLKRVINETLQSLTHLVKDNNAQITVSEDMPTVMCDAIRIGEVFLNLISNALKYNDKEIPKIDISVCDLAKGNVTLCVKDNGVGVSEKAKEKLFQIFQRIHADKYANGSGVGLTITKKVIERHNGRIWVESEVGRGTAFYFTLQLP